MINKKKSLKKLLLKKNCLAMPGMWKFPDYGSNPRHSSNLSLCSGNTRSLIHYTTRGLLKTVIYKTASSSFIRMAHPFQQDPRTTQV